MGRLNGARRAAFAVAAAGTLATVAVVWAAAMSARDALKLVALGGGTALAGGLVAFSLLRRLERTSVTSQVAALTTSTLTIVALGAWVGARAMFLSSHDLRVLLVLLLAAGTVALVSSLVLGARIGRARDVLIDTTRRIGDGGTGVTTPTVGPPHMAELARELAIAGDRLAEARRREQAVDASRRELVAWISHDLRTPLSGIRAIAEALEDGLVDDPGRYYALMREESERLSLLVDDLFELSRTQSGVLRLEFQRVSVDDVVSDAVEGIAPVADAKGVRVEGRVNGPIPPCAASPPELLRALRNILENAVRHTPSDGTVVVEAHAGALGAVLSVVDDGGGIPVDDLERVFVPGWRGDRARNSDGAGLGLAIAKGIVEAHNGELAVRNDARAARASRCASPTGPMRCEGARHRWRRFRRLARGRRARRRRPRGARRRLAARYRGFR